MNLYEAFRNPVHARMAFVGAGGKTTAMFGLARAMPSPVVVTCSTHLGAWQSRLADRHVVVAPGQPVGDIGPIEGVTLFTGPEGERERYQGLEAGQLTGLAVLSDRRGYSVLVEADGARQRALKAPAAHEPVIPEWVDTIAVVAGLSGLGKPLTEEFVHRPERFSQLSSLPVGTAVTEEGLAKVLAHPDGGLKGIPAHCERVLILNQADDEGQINAALRVATMVHQTYPSIIIAALEKPAVWRVVEPVAGVLLAGGGASRFGQPKMLLPWHGQPIIRRIAATALAAGLEPVIVVTGAWDGEIRTALEGMPVVFAHNPDWQVGQSSSIQAGLAALPAQTGAALFLLSDQPQVTADLITRLVERHQQTLAAITAPRIQGQRGNPVLFDQETFPALRSLAGDTGGRALFGQYPPDFLEWDDPRMLQDIDTPEDYERLKGEDL